LSAKKESFNTWNSRRQVGAGTAHLTVPNVFEEINKLLSEGWRLDRTINGSGIIPLENSAIYHLIKYSADEIVLMEQEKQEKEKSFSLKAESMISVPLADVDAKLKEGYEIIPDKIYAKEAVLVKWPKKEGA
jgi:hypothetical protein